MFTGHLERGFFFSPSSCNTTVDRNAVALVLAVGAFRVRAATARGLCARPMFCGVCCGARLNLNEDCVLLSVPRILHALSLSSHLGSRGAVGPACRRIAEGGLHDAAGQAHPCRLAAPILPG